MKDLICNQKSGIRCTSKQCWVVWPLQEYAKSLETYLKLISRRKLSISQFYCLLNQTDAKSRCQFNHP